MSQPIPRFRTLTKEENDSYDGKVIRPSLVMCEDGNLVAYSDYAALLAEVDKLKAELSAHGAKPVTAACLRYLGMLASGMTKHEIAQAVNVSIGSIDQVIQNNYKRIGAKNITQAVIWYIRNVENKEGSAAK